MNSQEIVHMFNRMKHIGMKQKISTLKAGNSPWLRKILYFMYDPRITYGIKAMRPTTEAGYENFDLRTCKVLEDLILRRYSGNKAKMLLRREYNRLNMSGRGLLSRVLNRSAGCGISVKTINKAIPYCIFIHEVMLPEDYVPKRLPHPEIMIQPKIDGIRATWMDGRLLSRKGLPLVGLQHITNELELSRGLDGELCVPGLGFHDAAGIIRSKKFTPEVRYIAFDMPGRPTLPARERHVELILGCRNYKFTHDIQSEFCDSDPRNVTRAFHLYRSLGYEGVVVKDPEAKYEFKQSFAWMKLKNVNSKDIWCVAVFKGTGKYSEILGYIVCQLESGKFVHVGSGFTDKQRKDFWHDPNLIVDKTVEIEYQELTPDGSLRDPRFKCIRFDK